MFLRYNYPLCEPCNCNPDGVTEDFFAIGGCDSVPEGSLCTCKENVMGRICDTCKVIILIYFNYFIVSINTWAPNWGPHLISFNVHFSLCFGICNLGIPKVAKTVNAIAREPSALLGFVIPLTANVPVKVTINWRKWLRNRWKDHFLIY